MTGGKCTQLDIRSSEATSILTDTVAASVLEQIGGKELVKAYYRTYVPGYIWVKNHYDHIKEIHSEQFQADFAIVTTRKKMRCVTTVLSNDLGIHRYDPKKDKSWPRHARSVYFIFKKKKPVDYFANCIKCKKFEEEDEIYVAIKFSAAEIDKIARDQKAFGDHKKTEIKCKFDIIMRDEFVAWDGR